VKELLVSHASVNQVLALEEWLKENQDWLLKSVANERSNVMTSISSTELEKISQLATPNQVIAVVKKFPVLQPVIKGKLSLVLDRIQDPGNLGTIIRTADWFGIDQIICSDDCAELYNPKVVQATMGSILRVKVFYTNLRAWLEKQNDIRIYATMLEGKDISKMSKLHEGLVLIGNESKGINEELVELANEKITIGKKGNAESLNAAVATGIILSHLA
jgi:TrmH family RNA methyltransferase